MWCPACAAPIAPDAWVCPACDHVVRADDVLALDADLLGDDGGETAELTAVPEARILGDLDDEPSVATFAGSLTGDGPSTRIVLYAPARSLAVLQPTAIVVCVEPPRTRAGSKLEALVLALVDGVSSVEELRRRAPFPAEELDGALLVLLDKGLVRLDVRRAAERPPSTLDPVYPTELTAEDAAEGSSVSDPTPILPRRASMPPRAASAPAAPAPPLLDPSL
ncbi:zinc ribbon domain-containing protein, partial [Myxococcota bacterium]|nr:zinc ribbon domain-containing protein [Myxococcota bacterium]